MVHRRQDDIAHSRPGLIGNRAGSTHSGANCCTFHFYMKCIRIWTHVCRLLVREAAAAAMGI